MSRVAAGVCLLLLVLGTIAPTVAGAVTVRAQPYEDLLFTDVSHVEAVEPWGEKGYVAATHGGLVLWPGEGPRTVLTRADGLPSNAVWDVAFTAEGLLVATEKGAVFVNLTDASVEPLDVDGRPGEVLEQLTYKIHVENGTWYVLERGGNLTVRDADGTWRVVDRPGLKRVNDLLIRDGEVLVASEGIHGRPALVHRLLDNGTWEAIADTPRAPVELGQVGDVVYVGLRKGGVVALADDGTARTLDLPENMVKRTPLEMATFAGELWVGTDDGLFIHTPDEATWRQVPSSQVPNGWVQTLIPIASQATEGGQDLAVLGTSTGLFWPSEDGEALTVHRTVNGPDTNQFTSVSARDGRLWAGTSKGLALYYPNLRVWAHTGLQEGLGSPPVHALEHQGDNVWMGTHRGVYKWDLAEEEWRVILDQEPDLLPGNRFFDVDPDGDVVWMPEYGTGLFAHWIGTNDTRKFQIQEGLLSHGLTCVDRWQEFLAVCSIEAFQLFNLSKSSASHPLGLAYNRCNNYACNYTAPGNHSWDALPDGPRIWVATQQAGLFTLNRSVSYGIDVGKHWTRDDGLPSDEVRTLAPADGGVWAGTARGLALVDYEDGVVQTWGRDDGLDHPLVNDLVTIGDTLYIATWSGLYRLDIPSGELLPLSDASGEFGTLPVTASIDYPHPNVELAGPVNVSGTADAPGSVVDRVRARIDGGPWQQANGTSDWRLRLPVDELAPGAHSLQVQAVSADGRTGNATLPFHVADTEAEPAGPPSLEHQPRKQVDQGSTYHILARVEGAKPLQVTLELQLDGEHSQRTGRVVAGTSSFTVSIPPDASGDLNYRFHVRSAGGEASFPETGWYSVPVEEPRVRDLEVRFDSSTLELVPGEQGTLTGTIVNGGTHAEQVRLGFGGLSASWASAEPLQFLVPPGDPVAFDATVTVPDDASSRTSVLLVNVRSLDEQVTATAPATLVVTEEVDATPQEASEEARDTPALAPLVVVLASVLLAIGRRRWDR